MEILVAALLLMGASVAWLLYRRNSRVAPVSGQPTLRLQGTGTYEFSVLGVARYQAVLQKLCDAGQVNPKIVEALLVPEENNARDKNAIRVELGGRTVGYLPPELAEAYRRRLAESGYPGARSTCKAKIIVRMHSSIPGNTDYAVRLDLPQKRTNGK
jgi:hypothetical protein